MEEPISVLLAVGCSKKPLKTKTKKHIDCKLDNNYCCSRRRGCDSIAAILELDGILTIKRE